VDGQRGDDDLQANGIHDPVNHATLPGSLSASC
jgi:hypothetical protein